MKQTKKKKNTHGGARPGAGRPRKVHKKPDDQYQDAQSYLEAVVRGETPADPHRIAAAKTLMAYQLPLLRAKAESPSPKKLKRKQQTHTEKHNLLKFEEKAAKIRAKYEATK